MWEEKNAGPKWWCRRLWSSAAGTARAASIATAANIPWHPQEFRRVDWIVEGLSLAQSRPRREVDGGGYNERIRIFSGPCRCSHPFILSAFFYLSVEFDINEDNDYTSTVAAAAVARWFGWEIEHNAAF